MSDHLPVGEDAEAIVQIVQGHFDLPGIKHRIPSGGVHPTAYDRAAQRPFTNVGRRYHEIEGSRLCSGGNVGDALVAAAGDLRDNGISIEAAKGHGLQ